MTLNWLRSALFLVLCVLYTCVHGPLVTLVALVNREAGYAIARNWCQFVLTTARYVCGIRYRVIGLEHVPKRPLVVMARHESAWETVALVALLSPQTWIVKRELHWLPLIGQCLWALKAIAIDRRAGKAARDQVVEQGRDRLAIGLNVIVFPEGTRVAPGQRKRYGLGGAMLSVATDTPILPVAHNAGDCWPRNAFVKLPGEVVISFGPVIEPLGRSAQSVSDETERWIERELTAIRTRPDATPAAVDAARA